MTRLTRTTALVATAGVLAWGPALAQAQADFDACNKQARARTAPGPAPLPAVSARGGADVTRRGEDPPDARGAPGAGDAPCGTAPGTDRRSRP